MTGAPIGGLVGLVVVLLLLAALLSAGETATARLSRSALAELGGSTLPSSRRLRRIAEDPHGVASSAAAARVVVEAAAGPQEITLANNRAAFTLAGVRDRLRVLLVSGEPHPGERAWRNLLKSDPAIDLVHFTILRPIEKAQNDNALESELALIEFPQDELFIEKLTEFDLVIFDRFTDRGVLNPFHFDNLARYVEGGGAVLVASGPEFAGPYSIAGQRNFSFVLPAAPQGDAIEAPFRPRISETGERHPVTAQLPERDEALEAAENGPVNDHRPMCRVVGADIRQVEPDRQLVVELDRPALPLAAQRVGDVEVDLRPVERPVAGVDLVRRARRLERGLQLRLEADRGRPSGCYPHCRVQRTALRNRRAHHCAGECDHVASARMDHSPG